MNARTIPRRRRTHGAATHRDILELAVDLASAEGLEGLTIGRLADDLALSKSGLFAHFGSKEQLQLATIERAAEIFTAEIIAPAEETSPGLERLAALIEYWISYVERSVFRGGCFFAAASAEFDGRPGPVRTRLAELTRAWMDMLVAETRGGRRGAELGRGTDAEQLVFEVHALVQEANWAWQLLETPEAFTRARRGVAARLETAATPGGRRALARAARRPPRQGHRSRRSPSAMSGPGRTTSPTSRQEQTR